MRILPVWQKDDFFHAPELIAAASSTKFSFVNYDIIKKASQKITCGKITIKGRREKAFSLKTKLTGDGKLTFKSLNSKIVKVTSRGKIILKKSGTGNYKAASKEVTLKVICRAAL